MENTPGTRLGQTTPSTTCAPEEVMAQFGEATLVRMNGEIVLRGGSMADRTEALEWLSMFMPEAVPSLK